MKKQFTAIFFVLTFLCANLSFGQGTLFVDYFDTYVAGQDLACQNPTNWTTWSNAPCGPEDAVISNAFSSSPSNSVKIEPNNDVVYVIPNFTNGDYSVVFKFYIPSGKSGYFNVLHLFAGGSSNWAFQCYLKVDGTATIDAGVASAASFNYTQGVWNTVEVRANMNGSNDIGTFLVNGVLIHTWQWSLGTFGGGIKQLGGVNLYGELATNEMYVDNFQLWDNLIPVEFTSFTASAGNGNVNLSWSTATETNNRGFEVERKTIDGQYMTVGFVQGAGTTTETQNYSFIDNSVSSETYVYRLKQVDFDGRFEYSNEVEVTAIGVVSYTLNQNYPNPFNPSTIISYSIPEAGNVKLAVFNMLGEEVALLFNGQQDAGNYQVTFDAKQLPSGSYFYKLESGSFVEAKKMLLTK